MKRLFLSRNEKKIAGVCGGLAEYIDIDPTIVRLVTIILAIATALFPVVIGYLLAWMIIPTRPIEPPVHQ